MRYKSDTREWCGSWTDRAVSRAVKLLARDSGLSIAKTHEHILRLGLATVSSGGLSVKISSEAKELVESVAIKV